MPHPRVAILISGRGSNMASLIAAAADPAYPAEIVAVISNRPDAPGLEIAASSGIPVEALDHKAFPHRRAFDAALDERLKAAKADLVCLAGFMRILSPEFIEAWPDRVINIHPSLLPSFPGIDTHARAIAAGVKLHGATVHYIRPGLDDGPIIAQVAVPVIAADTVESLAARVLAAEHRLYPLALALVARGEARVVNEQVSVEGIASSGAPGALYWPPAPEI